MNTGYMLKSRLSTKEADQKRDYYYATTRARAMISKLLTDDDYAKLMKMDINEILRFLEEGEYKKEIDSVGVGARKIEEFEGVLNENFARSINRLLGFMPKTCPLWVYTMRYDIANIKTILRGKDSHGKKEGVWRALIPVGNFSKEFLHSLINAETKEKVIELLEKTPYYSVLKRNSGKGQEELEDILEQFYFGKTLKFAVKDKKLYDLLKKEIDVKNILSLLRLRRSKIAISENFFIKGGNIGLKRLAELGKLDEFEIINNLKNQKTWVFAPTNTKELDKIEAGLRKYLFICGWNLKKEYKPTAGALLSYIFGKEREIANIRIIARSKIIKNPEDALSIRSRVYVK